MKRPIALLAVCFLAVGCESPKEEATVVRLLDLATSAQSEWPPKQQRFLPEPLRSLRGYRGLRKKKLARVAMFPESGGDSRRALLAPTGTSHRFRLRLPADAIMRTGLGYLPSAEAEGVRVRFVVRIAGLGAEASEKVDEKEVVDDLVVTTRVDGGWRDVEFDLSNWSGRDVELSLVTIGAESDPLVWAAWSAPEIVSREGSQAGPDVILIILDTLRADRLGCYGYPLDTSPNLDELASRGIRFTHAVSQAPWTYPSHRALFSGLYPTARALEGSPKLAEVLLEAGFRTEALTGGGQMDFRVGFSEGFEGYRVFDWIRNLTWLEEWLGRSSGRRRFLFLHTYEIHDPYVHTEFTEGKEGGRIRGRFGKRKWWGLRPPPTPEEKDYIGSLYDGGVAYTDAHLGAVFDLLEESGAFERSIVIVTSDHGEQFWEHGSWRHGMNLYDHQLLVPLIIHLPDSLKKSLASIKDLSGRVFDQQVRLVDLFPTILDLLGIAVEHRINGRSLKPLLRGDELPPVDAFAERLNVEHRDSKALRTERFKLIYSFPKAKGRKQGLQENWELFDLVRDPGEQINLADRHPEKVAELNKRLRTLLDLLADPRELDEGAQKLDPDLEERLRALGYLGD